MALAKPRNDRSIKIKKKDKAKDLILVKTSSLNNYFLCDHCGKKEIRKTNLARHVISCVSKRTCSWCKIVFKKRANLSVHSVKVHGNKSWFEGKSRENHLCAVCPKSYTQLTYLKYHIRREHFNLTLKDTSEVSVRQINEVWVERVMNTDALIEITKTGHSCYLMKKFNGIISLPVTKVKETMDLSLMYPTTSVQHKVWCDPCKRVFNKRDYSSHLFYVHKEKSEKNFVCNNCSKVFSRPYLFLRHVCGSKKPARKQKVVPHVDCVTVED